MKKFWKRDKHPLDREIEYLTEKLDEYLYDEPEYNDILTRLEQIITLRNEDTQKWDKNVLLSTAGSLAGILLIINHERAHIITTKAMSFIPKPKGRI